MSRNRQSAKQAGAKFQSDTASFFADTLGDDRIEVRHLSGAKDRGDITGLKLWSQRVVVECKDYGGEVHVGTWLNEAEVERENDKAFASFVVAKRRGFDASPGKNPGKQIVLMTLDDLIALVTGERP